MLFLLPDQIQQTIKNSLQPRPDGWLALCGFHGSPFSAPVSGSESNSVFTPTGKELRYGMGVKDSTELKVHWESSVSHYCSQSHRETTDWADLEEG